MAEGGSSNKRKNNDSVICGRCGSDKHCRECEPLENSVIHQSHEILTIFQAKRMKLEHWEISLSPLTIMDELPQQPFIISHTTTPIISPTTIPIIPHISPLIPSTNDHVPEEDDFHNPTTPPTITRSSSLNVETLNIDDPNIPKSPSDSTSFARQISGIEDSSLITDDSDDEEQGKDAVSDDEEEKEDKEADNFVFGTAFEKVEEYDRFLDHENPWHRDLHRPLFPSQIIGYRWMIDRHSKGGGLVGDKVGCGKVYSLVLPI